MLDPSGHKSAVEIGVRKLCDATEEGGSPQRPDEYHQLALRDRPNALRIPESYSQPSHDAGVVLIPEDKGDLTEITGIGTNPALGATERGSSLLKDDALNIESPTTITHVTTHTVESNRASVSTFITAPSFRSSVATFQTAESGLHSIKRESATSRSSWYKLLKSENLIPRPLEEKDWSGRGEHAEFSPNEWSKILDILPVEGLLGNSATAIVESVRCRRVLLARKTVRCNRRMKRTDALKEVQHLKKFKHSHIVQVVGTYTFKQDLAILLYPAAEYNLETFMESIITESPGREGFPDHEKVNPKLRALTTFFGCLAHTIHFLHYNATKHMDIKPKNLLIKDMRYGSSSPHERYKVYIADFGITRSYKRAADAETDSPTPFTRMYAAPEVVNQRKRGLSADIFSLGCVFAEMLAVLSGSDRESKREDLLAVASSNQDSLGSYQANLPLVEQWLREIRELNCHNLLFLELTPMLNHIVEMIDSNPGRRPSAKTVASWFAPSTPCCTNATGPDTFSIERTIGEDAEDEDNSKAKSIYEQDIETFHSVFQVCVSLQKRLKRVPGFGGWMQGDIHNPYDDAEAELLTMLWKTFQLGHPLVDLYNLVNPRAPLIVDESVPENQRARHATLLFLRACIRDLQIPLSECFTLTHMYSYDILGLLKVAKVVDRVLDILETSGVLHPDSFDDRHKVSESVTDAKIRSLGSSGDITVSHILLRPISEWPLINKFVYDEWLFVHRLEILHSFKEFLEEIGTIDGDDMQKIFWNLDLILDLHRRFLVRVEQMFIQSNTLPCWGEPFELFKQSFTQYCSYIMNLPNSLELAKRNFERFAGLRGRPEIHELAEKQGNLIAFLLEPLNRLKKYLSFLQELSDTLHKSYVNEGEEWVSRAFGLISNILGMTGGHAKLDGALHDLILRVKDWKDHEIENSGGLLLHGTFEMPEEKRPTDREAKTPVSQIDLQYQIYLFEKILLVCKESPTRRIPANITSLKNLSSARSTGHVLNLKGRIFIQNISATEVLEAHGSYILKIHFYGATGMETIPIRFTTLDMMEQWANQIYRIRQKCKFVPRGSGINDQISGSGFAVFWGSQPVGGDDFVEHVHEILPQPKADLPTSIKFKVHCSEIGKTLALVVWSDITYDALKRYIEAESQLFRDCSNFCLYAKENRPTAITSDKDLQIHLDAWWKAVTNGTGSHYLELWYTHPQ